MLTLSTDPWLGTAEKLSQNQREFAKYQEERHKLEAAHGPNSPEVRAINDKIVALHAARKHVRIAPAGLGPFLSIEETVTALTAATRCDSLAPTGGLWFVSRHHRKTVLCCLDGQVAMLLTGTY